MVALGWPSCWSWLTKTELYVRDIVLEGNHLIRQPVVGAVNVVGIGHNCILLGSRFNGSVVVVRESEAGSGWFGDGAESLVAGAESFGDGAEPSGGGAEPFSDGAEWSVAGAEQCGDGAE
jgi:hypothetical protein